MQIKNTYIYNSIKEKAEQTILLILLVILFFIIILRISSASPDKTLNQIKPAIGHLNQGYFNLQPGQSPGVIEGIGWSKDGQRIVMLDGEIYHEGDIFKGCTINKICPDRIEYEKNSEIWVQTIPKYRAPTQQKVRHQSSDYKQTGYQDLKRDYSKYRSHSYSQPFVTNKSTYYARMPIRSTSKIYIFTEDDHWIRKNIDSGRFIQLEDKSLWEINPSDKITSRLWSYLSEIVVVESQNPHYPYLLINTEDAEKVEAKLISD